MTSFLFWFAVYKVRLAVTCFHSFQTEGGKDDVACCKFATTEFTVTVRPVPTIFYVC